MKIYVLDKVLEYPNSEDEIKNIFNEIDEIISKSKYAFSHLEVDGYEVYEDFQNYFLDNIRNIEEVKVIAKTFKEFVIEILNTTAEYFENAIPEIEILSDEFYKTPTGESWNKLSDLIQGVKWIMDSFVIIDQSDEIKDIVKSYETWNLYAKDIYSLRELLEEFEEILENEDLVSTADILSYEIAPLFNEMLNKLNILVDRKVGTSALS
ncbi:hypothetical protein [Anaerosalibacter sp. Marseille-P3206]|uniref:hypothetical protein n=1 Tax=Anaerosalibacter sp. Marseille-P3206 TaxID=1871005 RepID=UPI000986580E|nr:hypothetical protein [Anaerosalibacter sp. Marseille-P3206]